MRRFHGVTTEELEDAVSLWRSDGPGNRPEAVCRAAEKELRRREEASE